MLVKGSNRGLLQDLNEKKIYSIDKGSKELLSELNKGKKISTILAALKEEDKEGFSQYLQLLVDKNLGSFSDLWIKPEKLNKSLMSKIDTVWLELRKGCNLNCCHCYLDSNPKRDKGLKLLSLREWLSIIEELKKYKPKRIILIGGEPLLFEDIEKLISSIRNSLLSTEIILYSNLTLLTESTIKCLSENKVKVITSIYSSSAEVHDKITRSRGSFDKTIAAIKKLKKSNVFPKANTVVMKYNEKEVKSIKEYIYSLTGKNAKFDIIRDVGIAKKELIPTQGKGEQEKKKLGFKGISKEEYIRNISGNSCWQGKLNISCDGYVSPCIMGEGLIDKSFNVRNNTLEEILEEYLKPRFWSLTRDKLDTCRECEYRYVCKDCRPKEMKDNNLYGKDKNCTYEPVSGKQ